jgi:hypothetical protein
VSACPSGFCSLCVIKKELFYLRLASKGWFSPSTAAHPRRPGLHFLPKAGQNTQGQRNTTTCLPLCFRVPRQAPPGARPAFPAGSFSSKISSPHGRLGFLLPPPISGPSSIEVDGLVDGEPLARCLSLASLTDFTDNDALSPLWHPDMQCV